jgi:hypothetical protein
VLLLAASVSGAAVANPPDVKKFSASLTLTQSAGYTAEYTLRNDETSNQTLGSANIAIPSAYGSITYVSGLPNGWSLTPTESQLELRSDNQVSLAPGQSLTFSFSIGRVGCGGPHEWTTRVKQSNTFNGTGNDFTLVGKQPATTVSSGTATRYSFDAVDSPQAKGAPVAFTLRALDDCGNQATSYGETAGVAFGSGPNSSIATSVTFSGGAATGSLAPTASQPAATLVATGALGNGTSSPFAIVDFLCTAGASCDVSDGQSGTFVSTTLSNGKLAVSFERGGSASCVAGSSLIGSRITLDPYYSTATAIELRWSKTEAPGTGVANFVLCWDKPNDGKAPAPLALCGRKPEGTCELRRSRNGVGELVIRIQLAPYDPQFDLG